MKIAIIGTRGIPNHHGGFEQFAEYFAVFMAKQGHNVVVYNSHNHPYREEIYQNVQIIRCFDPEYVVGTVGQFIYDLNCILDSRKRNADIILQLGYTSSSIWHRLLPKKSIITTNMDGLEWKRTKYKPLVRKFLKYAEKLAALNSDFLISDSIGIKNYLKEKYNKDSEFIAYGANLVSKTEDEVLNEYNVKKYEYCILIARLEPENNIETILEGYFRSNTKYPILIFGTLNKYGFNLKNRFNNDPRIRFVGANYDINKLDSLRHYSRYYFHGHSVGGTNPSLLEAMASYALIIANNNIFNISILNDEAKYFTEISEITEYLNQDKYFKDKESFGRINQQKIIDFYSWNKINKKYEAFLNSLIK
jgi:hypothetical protein